MPANTVPTKLKILKGTDQKCRTNELEPEYSVDGIKPPSSFNGRYLNKWNEVYSKLAAVKVMTIADIDNVEAYVNAYWAWFDATEECRNNMLIEKDGVPMVNPMHRVQKQYFDQMLALMRDLGMTPASRTKVKTTEKKTSDSGFGGI